MSKPVLMLWWPAVLALLVVSQLRAQSVGPDFSRHFAAITASESRLVGSAGYDAATDYVLAQARALPGVTVQEHAFAMMAPRSHGARLEFAGGAAPVYPVFPSGVRLNTTPLGGVSGKLVYCGRGQYADIAPAALAGNIAVVEADADDAWKTLAYFGAKAIVILPGAQVTHMHLRSYEVPIPIELPRFYLADNALADRLRKGEITAPATLTAAGDWQRVTARNVYVYVPARDPLPPAKDKGGNPIPWAALAVVTPIDAAGIVPDYSPAAGQAAQPAAALAMLRQIAENPLRRPVLFCFTGGDGLNLYGTRQMLMALADPPQKWRNAAVEVDERLAAAQRDLETARGVNGDPTKLDITRHRSLIDRIVQIIETDVALEQDELFRLRLIGFSSLPPDQQARLRQIEGRQIALGQLRYAYNSDPAGLGQFGADAPVYLQRAIERLGGESGGNVGASGGSKIAVGLTQQLSARKAELDRRIELFHWLAGVLGREKEPGLREFNKRLIELMVGLDLSDKGERVGPMFFGKFAGDPALSPLQEHREWFQKILDKPNEPQNAWFKPIAPLLSFEPLQNVRTPASFLVAPVGLPCELGTSWGLPAMTLATLEDLRATRDTPADTVANLDPKAIVRQADAVLTLLRYAWNDPAFKGQPEFRRNSNEFSGQVVSTASGRPVPDLPRDGFLATYYYTIGDRKIPAIKGQPYAVGVRRVEVRDCDAEGHYTFEALPKLTTLKQLGVKVYRLEKSTGEITAGTDLGKQAGDIKTKVNLDDTVTPLRSVVFDCEQFTLFGLYDPRFLQWLGEVQIMDARRNAEPQRFDAAVHGQMMAGELEPGSRAYLLFRYGRIGNRLVLLNVPTGDEKAADEAARLRGGVTAEGQGYTIAQLNNLGPLALATARDFWRLNDGRIEQYRKAGVTSTLIDSMHKNAATQIAAADKGLTDPGAEATMKNATGAWADEARVYDASQRMANDVVYAAIFLLLLAVPFSFCMERLLIGTPSIYKQIAGASAVFGMMAAALWAFHPAFKITSSPLIIILAFAIILMSLIVIGVVYSKFDTELKRIRSGRGVAEGASFASASVMMSAVMLGIANMRRRKFRTALTSITVVLITFAVLCFTSSSRYQGTVALPTGVDASYPGLQLRQRGFRPMPGEIVDSLAAVYPGVNFVQRWWTLTPDSKEMVHLVAGGAGVDGKAPRVVAMQGLLGLTSGETDLSPIAQVIPGIERLERGETNVIYLAATVAEQLKVKIGDNVKIAGIPLQVAGLYDANDFDQRMITLAGEPIAPLKYSTGALDAGGRALSDNALESLDLGGDDSAAEASMTYDHLPASQFAIVPAEVSKLLEFTSLRSLGARIAADDAKPADRDAAVKAVVDDVIKRFALATFAGYSDGVKLVSASNLSSIGGGANVAIPLAIGGLIIFNTMMGSIAERRREIHVYTSLGLAPMHVGALFVAEALTYGLIGSVFGYIIGQGVGTLLLKLGWLGNVTLNYSGSSAMLTLGLILLIVLLSALVPARLASKIAAPSIDRSWRVPAPQGDQILATLPFTINRTAAEGVVGYLAEFFQAHQEGSIGKFSAGRIEAFADTGTDGQPTRGLKTVVWLTPFDLGVRQHLLLLIHPGEFADIYEVQVVLERLSGDDGSWYRMNRSFLTELRKQFLQWRSLSPERMRAYVKESKSLFRQIPERVVTTDTTEEVRLG